MKRVVLDTNVLVSAVLGGRTTPVLAHWRAGHFTLVVTEAIVREYLTVLRRPKFGLPAEVVDDIAGYVFRKAEFVTPIEHLTVIVADPTDDKFLEAAVAGEAEVIVSGNKHLLDLKTFRQVAVLTVHEFLGELGE